ncbi:MAG: 2Fe-2S iron-sulfur cluster-binding protein [Sulfurovum sp.]
MREINILRSQNNSHQSYSIPDEDMTLLDALGFIKANLDATVTFSAGCRASVCGSCAVRVNGIEVLVCEYRVEANDTVEPLNYHKVRRDLKVDKSNMATLIQETSSWIKTNQTVSLSYKDEKMTETQSDCILCNSCYSSCPVYAVNPDFLGPFALTRAYRYSIDPREVEIKQTIDNIQTNGVWDCTLCGECTAVCPKGIDPKMDITMLRGISIQNGYEDPSFANMSFGFDPNGGF